MTWNYRVIHFTDSADPSHADYYAVHEVYYNEDGKPFGYSEIPAYVTWDEGEEGMDILNQMLKAFERPVLTPADMFKKE